MLSLFYKDLKCDAFKECEQLEQEHPILKARLLGHFGGVVIGYPRAKQCMPSEEMYVHTDWVDGQFGHIFYGRCQGRSAAWLVLRMGLEQLDSALRVEAMRRFFLSKEI